MYDTKHYLNEARRCTAHARGLYDEFDGKPMPAEVAHQIETLLGAAGDNRRKFQELHNAEPQYRFDRFSTKDGGYGLDRYDGLPLATKQFLDYVRTGDQSILRKASLIEDSTGLSLVPPDFVGTIVKALSREGVFRQIAYVKRTTKETVDIGNVSFGTPTWGRLEVTGGPPADGLDTVGKDTVTVHELTALIKIGVDELMDTDENLEATIRQGIAEKFAEVEDDAFASGNGTLKPFGVTASTASPITQTVTAGANNTPTPDDLKKLTYQVGARFRRNGVFVGHSKVEQAIALMKDSEGRFLFTPSASQGEAGTLFGYPWFTADGMPDPAATGTATDASVVFGDFQAGYLIADRQRFTVQRLSELYATEGKVGLLLKERVGGDVMRPAALAKYLL